MGILETLTPEQLEEALNYVGPESLGWARQDVIDYFDSTNITLEELSRKSGYPVEYLKEILMS